MKIAVFGQAYKTGSLGYIKDLLKLLSENEVHIVDEVYDLIKDDLNKIYKTFPSNKSLSHKYDYMISVGGDGTILRAATIIRNSNIPIIGINTGRLGFLATIHKKDMSDALEQLLAGNFQEHQTYLSYV